MLHVPSLKLSIAPEGKDDQKEGHGTVSLKKTAPGKNVVLLNCHKKKNSAIDQCPVVRKSTKCLLRIKTTNNHGLNIAGKVSDSPGLI